MGNCIDCKKKISFYSKRCRKCNDIFQIGKNNPNFKHGFSKGTFKDTYYHIKNRCNNPKSQFWNFYGGRGIKCEWKSFIEFKNDMYKSYLIYIKKYGMGQKNVSIDRIDNNGNYCKENCRWATAKQQARNTRKNVLIEFRGETKCIAQWAEQLNVPYIRIYLRIFRSKWSVEKAFTIPKMVNQFK